MANLKNTARSKRKYGDKRITATARNRTARNVRAELRLEKFRERNQNLVGKLVQMNGNKNPINGIVLTVEGNVLVITTKTREFIRLRKRVKLV